jgi:predicted DNA binding CopG/RHH family protein
MLAAFAAPAPKRSVAWNDDELADDVATLSYERALRTHARFRAPDLDDRALTQSAESGHSRLHLDEAPAVGGDLVAEAEASQAASAWEADTQAADDTSTAHDRNLKCASITIRLSRAEVAQLRERAAEAGLTVSAYLRSCTVEAESLRAQVKDTLAHLRSESSKEIQAAEPPAGSSWFGWLRWFWPNPHGRNRAVRV